MLSVFEIVCNYLTPFIKCPRRNLSVKNQILLTLVCLRLNLPQEYLSHQVNLLKSTINSTFHKVLNLIYSNLSFLVRWPGRDYIRQTLPPLFKQYFPRLTSITDCFEIFIDRPRNLKARAAVYSNYKKHSTIKYLIACSPIGAITFLSKDVQLIVVFFVIQDLFQVTIICLVIRF